MDVTDGITLLSEETFLKEMGKIIERDFFPDLPAMRIELGNDVVSPKNAQCSVRERRRKKPCKNTQLKQSLNEFLNSHTSEDNFKMSAILRSDTEKHNRSRLSWLHDQKNSLHSKRMDTLMLFPSGMKPVEQKGFGISYKNTRSVGVKSPNRKKFPKRSVNSGPILMLSPKPGTPLFTWGKVTSTPLPLRASPKTFQTPNTSPFQFLPA